MLFAEFLAADQDSGGTVDNTGRVACVVNVIDPFQMRVFHHRNFVDGVKSREECVAPAETAHRSITPGHIAYVAQAVGRKLKWDPAKEEVVGDAEAQKKLMALPYRAPWKLS